MVSSVLRLCHVLAGAAWSARIQHSRSHLAHTAVPRQRAGWVFLKENVERENSGR